MRMAIIGTYLPRECGIATFTKDLYDSMLPDKSTFIVALDNPDDQHDYPEEVEFIIREDSFIDYEEASRYINQNADICLLQHEFNIFGGDEGLYVLSLLNKLKIPLISTLHTVLKKPSVLQKYIIESITDLSVKVTVLSQVAADILSSSYNISKEKISMIRHGVPDLQHDHLISKEKLDLKSKTVLLTFGLINRNKGIETVIKSLREIINDYPDVIYIILGKTHPAISRLFGETYREYLEKMVEDYDLKEKVKFINRFVPNDELYLYLAATDILITPYLNEEQVSSGPLSFAMGAGNALVSTPFWHAAELLANGRGKLFEYKDYKSLSLILEELIGDPDILNRYKHKSIKFGKKIIWPVIGHDYLSLVQSELEEWNSHKSERTSESICKYPPISFRYINDITYSTGVINNAKYGIPNIKTGYHLKDNARALFAANMLYQKTNQKELKTLIRTYLSFIQHMQKQDGTFRDVLGYNLEYQEGGGSDLTYGIVLSALGYIIMNAPEHRFQQLAKEIFNKALKSSEKIEDINGIAYSVIGLCYYMQAFQIDQVAEERLFNLSDKLSLTYQKNRSDDWRWFQFEINSENAILPLSLLCSSGILQNSNHEKIAFESLWFLTDLVIKNDKLSLIGNKNRFLKGGVKPLFDQLPVEVMSLILLYKKAYEISRDIKFYKMMMICFEWFLGKNDLYVKLYDPKTRGCYDGIQEKGLNVNQSAESSLAFIISNMALNDVRKKIKESKVD